MSEKPVVSWQRKVGVRYQITIRCIAPLLNIAPGDWIELVVVNGVKELTIRKVETTKGMK